MNEWINFVIAIFFIAIGLGVVGRILKRDSQRDTKKSSSNGKGNSQ